MNKLEKMFNPEKMGINDFVIEIITSLGDEQDFDIDVLENKSPLSFHFLHSPHSIAGTEPIPTEEELKTFMNVAISRMKDVHEDYNWSEGLRMEFEPHGAVFVWLDEDKLGLE